MVLFTLSAFNSNVTMSTIGAFDASAASILDTSANATLEVNLQDMLDTFKFSTESTNFDDVSANDVRYYVYRDSWSGFTDASLNVVNAEVLVNPIVSVDSTSIAYPSNQMLVKHDFIRYIAQRLFNTAYGVDLFSNEDDLIANLNSLGGLSAGVLSQIKAKLDECDVLTQGDVATSADTNGVYYATDVNATTANLSRELLRQLYASAPSRFSELSTSTINSIPFQANDVITFKLSIDAAPTQNVLTNVAAIPTRTYTITLLLTADPSNPVPADLLV
jgi:hypothetical protein